MHVLLFLIGMIAAGAGTAVLGVAINEYRLGGGATTMMLPGTIGALGGFGLIGLGAILVQLRRLSDVVETRPLSLPVPAPPQVVAALAAAAGEAATETRTKAVVVEDAPAASPNAVPAVAPVAEKSAAPAPSEAAKAPENVAPATPPAAVVPLRVGPGDRFGATPGAVVAAAAPPAAPVAVKVEPLAPAQESGVRVRADGPAVLKSGVIEGMAYTLYADGAVDADLPQQGTTRFASIAEWRAHMRGG